MPVGRPRLFSFAGCLAMALFASVSRAQAPAPASVLTPPRILEAPPPVYPASRSGSDEHPSVVLHVVIGPDGAVSSAEVEHSAGEDFDAAALEAVRRWRFEPARRDGTAIASRVHVAVHFELPEFHLHGAPEAVEILDAPVGVESSAVAAEEAAPAPAPAPALREPEAPPVPARRAPEFGAEAEVTLRRLRPEERGPTDVRLDARSLALAPQSNAADLLRVAPGFFVARGEGDAVAHRIMLRGFDAEHGQDIELSLGGVPLNEPSHLHGQGYADLGWLPPEVVRSVRVIEGVYDPAQGDFAVAGSVDFELGVDRRGLVSRSTVGSFGTFRQLAVVAPEGFGPETFVATTFRRTDGFGANRAGRSGALIGQLGFRIGEWRARVGGAFHAARYGLAGVVRADDVAAGRVGFYGVYDFPTALAQNASSSRAMLFVAAERRADDGATTDALLWLSRSGFRLLENLTGFVQRSQLDPTWVGRGDLVEQENVDTGVGVRIRHRGAAHRFAEGYRAALELGASGRIDFVDQAQRLLQAPQNQTWDERVDASVVAMDVGSWVDAELTLSRWLTIRGGLRADFLHYDVEDRLGNFIPSFRRDSYVIGFRRSAAGVAFGPRATMTLHASRAFDVLVAYGEGYRSPQARILDDGETTPFTKVRSADAGLRWRLGDAASPKMTATLSGFFTRLSDDIVFDADENRLERSGPTTRLGGTLLVEAHPLDWLDGVVSATVVRATLDEPPPPTPAEPSPPYVAGQRLPFVPEWVLRADVGVHGELAELGGEPVDARLGAGLSHVGARPLTFGGSASPFTLLDLLGSIGWRGLAFGLEVTNLLDARYAATELSFVSQWDPSALPSRVPARHRTAGAPRTVLFTLEVRL